MPNNSDGSRRPWWLNWYRAFTTIAIAFIVAASVITLNELSDLSDRSFAPISTTQASKVERAAALLQTVGFNDPVYLGITPGAEGEYPTFRATAIGGKTIDLWIRTTRNGGLEIQPAGIFETVTSADDFAGLAAHAVFEWEHIPADTKPSTDGSYGEYESRKHRYGLLAQYNPSKEYWNTRPNETRDWPRK